jgi:hypothetical protein
VCLSPKQSLLSVIDGQKDSCMKDFEFIAITEVKGLNDGL